MKLTWKMSIDSESSVDVFNNEKYLTRICKVEKPLMLHCNAGCILINQKCWFGLIEVWYYPKGIVNILSLKTLKQCHHVTDDSPDRDGVFKVHTNRGIVEFQPYEKGLHYLNLEENDEARLVFVTTIHENYKVYTKKQEEGAIKACRLQAMVGYPSKKDVEHIVHANLLANFPVTPENVTDTYEPFGENVAGLRGMTVYQKPGQVVMDVF